MEFLEILRQISETQADPQLMGEKISEFKKKLEEYQKEGENLPKKRERGLKQEETEVLLSVLE